MNIDIESIIKEAKTAAQYSYSPYSQFKVGAALVDQNGQVFTGCNVENLSFPCGICAEGAAIAKGVSAVGIQFKIDLIVIYTPTATITTPCGACRQIIKEFSHAQTRVVCSCDTDDSLDMLISDLLPFSPNMELKKNP